MFKITSVFSLFFQVLLINNAIAQYTIAPTIQAPRQILSTTKQIPKQQLINYLLSDSNQYPLSERIEVLAAAVQQMPPRKNKRIYLADVLKQLAFQNLLVAASVCEATNTVAIPEYVTPLSRVVDYAPSGNWQPSALPNRRNLVVANVPNEPLVANKELSLLPRELLTLLSGDYLPNRAVRYQYV